MRVCLRKSSVLVELWNEVWYSEAKPPWLMWRGGVILLFPERNTFKRPDEDTSEKTGPARFWALIKGELATVLIVNLLFLITCIPVITIPPALLWGNPCHVSEITFLRSSRVGSEHMAHFSWHLSLWESRDTEQYFICGIPRSILCYCCCLLYVRLLF